MGVDVLFVLDELMVNLLDEFLFEFAHLALVLERFVRVGGRNFKITGCWLDSFI